MSDPTALGLGGPKSFQTKASVNYQLEMALFSIQIGIWIWEYLNTISLDYKLITGKRPLRVQGVIFITIRVCLTVSVMAVLLSKQGFSQINCTAVWRATNVFTTVGDTGSRLIFLLRAMAAWNYSLRVVIPMSAFWLLFVVLCMFHAQMVEFEAIHSDLFGWRCQPTTHMQSTFLWPCLASIAFDVTTSVLTLFKLCNVSKRSHLRLLHVVVRDAWVFSALSIIPTVSSIVLLCVKNYVAIFELVPLDNLLHVILASRAYAAIFESGLTMLPHEEQVVKKVVNGDILDQQARNRLAFKMNDRSTATQGDSSGSHRFEGSIGEERYLPGAMSREIQDLTPPFSDYFSNKSVTVILTHENDPYNRFHPHHGGGGIEVPAQAQSSSTGDDHVMKTVLESSQLSPICTPPSVLHRRQLQRAPPSADVASLPSIPRVTFSVSPAAAPETPQHYGARNKLFVKRLREAQSLSQLDTTGANVRERGPCDDEPPHSAGAVVGSCSTQMNVLVGVDVDVRVECKEAFPLPLISQSLHQGQLAPESEAGTSLGSAERSGESKEDQEKASGNMKRKKSFAPVVPIPHGLCSRGSKSGGPSPQHRTSFLRDLTEHGPSTGARSVDGSCSASQLE
ncbi:unnamed protein product [Tilletia laevis]|uniref:Transmembrane protein n=3 Tax=Tilletia TaxID=13289 RepID=A0A9N8LDP8_9BASI|nr:hypothetical protein CF336_g4623 [Tilletia laevis]CAD6891240.1 unnamed protein product [Tilletia caries]CAD6902753.1 unnamed protein product [Tilletia caries]CAD6910463.1 unnamed protein product [Tilletia laevis]CAD6966513.1 unnamed protein product [Tilletia laevis]